MQAEFRCSSLLPPYPGLPQSRGRSARGKAETCAVSEGLPLGPVHLSALLILSAKASLVTQPSVRGQGRCSPHERPPRPRRGRDQSRDAERGRGAAAVYNVPQSPDNSSGIWEVKGVRANSGGPLGFRGGRGPSQRRVQGALHAGGSTGPLSWTWTGQNEEGHSSRCSSPSHTSERYTENRKWRLQRQTVHWRRAGA